MAYTQKYNFCFREKKYPPVYQIGKDILRIILHYENIFSIATKYCYKIVNLNLMFA